jgi:hypothetical protein
VASWCQSDRAGYGMGAAGLELLDNAQQVADRTRETVEPYHYQRFAGGDVTQQARQHRAAAVAAGGVLLQDCGAACSAEFVALRVGFPVHWLRPARSRSNGLPRQFLSF